MMPELNSPIGQAASTGLATTPAYGGAAGILSGVGLLGLNGLRALNTRNSVLVDLENIRKDDFIPNQPGFWSYLLNGLHANTRENFINSLPADEYRAYLSNKAEDEKQRGWSQSRVIDNSPYNTLKERSMRPSFGNK
jgi:hypothetical protein